MGKLLSTRRFNQSIIVDFAAGAWPTKRKVKVQQVSEDIFKFTFGSKEDKILVFNKRPWSFNGALLVLKE